MTEENREPDSVAVWDGRENGAQVVSASRLIADTTQVNDILPRLVDAIQADSGLLFSVDDLVFAVKFRSPSDGERMCELVATVQCDGVPVETVTNKPNRFRFMYSFAIGATSVRLSIGWIEPGGKTDMTRGKLQFNPNKCADDSRLMLLCRKVARFAKRIELRRYDLAIDIPVRRNDCRLCRSDHRTGYEFIDHGNGQTEYLGTRNKPGRVKLYDKTREAGLAADWTRLEMTCDPNWTAEQVLEHLPVLFAWGSDVGGETRKWVRTVGKMAAALAGYGEALEPYLSELSRESRAVVAAYLASPRVEIGINETGLIVERAKDWETMVSASCSSSFA